MNNAKALGLIVIDLPGAFVQIAKKWQHEEPRKPVVFRGKTKPVVFVFNLGDCARSFYAQCAPVRRTLDRSRIFYLFSGPEIIYLLWVFQLDFC